MATMKTLLIRPADIGLRPLGAASVVAGAQVSVVYDRDVWVDAQPIPRAPMVTTMVGADGVSVPVLVNDDPSITQGAGFAIEVVVTTDARQGWHGARGGSSGARIARTIQVTSADPDVVPLGSKPDLVPVPDPQQYADVMSAIQAAAEVKASAAQVKASADAMTADVAGAKDAATRAATDAAAAKKAATDMVGPTDTGVAQLVQSGASTRSALDAAYAKPSDLAPYLRSDDAPALVAPLVGTSVKLSRYAKADGTDQALGVQAAIATAMSAGVPLECDVAGFITLGSGIVLGDDRANSYQRSILTLVGDLKVRAGASMERLITMQGTLTTTACNIEADAAGKAYFAVYCKNFGRATFGRIYTSGGLTAGLAGEPSGNNNAFSIEKLRVTGCGSKWTGKATLQSRSAESGWASTGDNAPYSTWTLDAPLSDALAVREWAAPAVIFADGRYMQIRRVVDASTIEVFNEDRAVGTSEQVTIIAAAVNFPYYGDVGVWHIGAADVRDNPNAAALNYGGYGGQVGTWAQQNNHSGVMVLKKAMGLAFGHFYTELSGGANGTAWLVVRDVASSSIFVGPGTNSTPGAWQGMSLSWMNPAGRNKQPLHWTMHKPSGSPLTMPPAVPIDAPEYNPGTRNLTPGTVQAYRRASGNFALRIDNTYTSGGVGIVKLAAPQGGTTSAALSLLTSAGSHTIEGAATLSVPVVGEVTLAYWLEGTTWRVRSVGTPQDTITSTSAAPTRVGQVAVVSGVIYMAAGTSAPSDWKQVS